MLCPQSTQTCAPFLRQLVRETPEPKGAAWQTPTCELLGPSVDTKYRNLFRHGFTDPDFWDLQTTVIYPSGEKLCCQTGKRRSGWRPIHEPGANRFQNCNIFEKICVFPSSPGRSASLLHMRHGPSGIRRKPKQSFPDAAMNINDNHRIKNR